MNDRILHIVCDHHGRQVISVYDHFCDFKNLCCSLRIKSGGMFIQKQKLWFLERSHQKCQSLSLSTGKKSDLGGEAILESKTKNLKQFFVFLAFCLGDTRFQKTGFATALCECKVFFDTHSSSGASHRILENTSKIGGTFMFR